MFNKFKKLLAIGILGLALLFGANVTGNHSSAVASNPSQTHLVL